LILGLIYLVVFAMIGGQGNLAVAMSLFAISLSIEAYANSTASRGAIKNRGS
jgi:hypothetical protein